MPMPRRDARGPGPAKADARFTSRRWIGLLVNVVLGQFPHHRWRHDPVPLGEHSQPAMIRNKMGRRRLRRLFRATQKFTDGRAEGDSLCAGIARGEGIGVSVEVYVCPYGS